MAAPPPSSTQHHQRLRCAPPSLSSSSFPLPHIPDADEQSPLLLRDLDDILSSAGGDDGGTINDDDDDDDVFRRRQSQRSSTLIMDPQQLCGDMACQAKVFQLPLEGDNKTVLESWTITFHARTKTVSAWYHWLGICWWTRTEAEDAHVLSVVPNAHFSQAELASVVESNETLHHFSASASSSHRSSSLMKKRKNPPQRSYPEDLERRLRKLDWKVQDEIYDLLNDRVQSSSNAYRRRDWKVVVLVEVPGGEMTDARSLSSTGAAAAAAAASASMASLQQQPNNQHQQRLTGRLPTKNRLLQQLKLKNDKRLPAMPITEYRLILRGTETKTNEEGWAAHNRYSRPWRDVDERDLLGVGVGDGIGGIGGGEKQPWSRNPSQRLGGGENRWSKEMSVDF
ncbi:hypothetical protein B0H63DRAFT_191660 [Podospora didyma]|uniref:Uncharacterized protein n=1 Tax=Podospora didyma TaxID=330526 RepID=A0AAE0NQX4_9PEZI|nr:hypothetical protein B0H63DRAFT_191660 [Podospora didyma]